MRTLLFIAGIAAAGAGGMAAFLLGATTGPMGAIAAGLALACVMAPDGDSYGGW